MIQGSDEWLQARIGKATASRMGDITARLKTGIGYGASRANYMAELVSERLTGVPFESYASKPMLEGRRLEPEARLAYEFEFNVDVEQVGFITHPTIPMSGASPDGLVGRDGMVEVKCPLPATHINTLLGTLIDLRYIGQMQWQLACTQRKWCDWVSYCPSMPENMQLFVRRIPRDEAVIAGLTKDVIQFLKELDDRVESLMQKYVRG